MTLAGRLWAENHDLAERAVAHPFVRGIADGTLPPGTFARYVAQDAYFLETFARAYALAVAHSTDRRALDDFADLLAGVIDELRLHERYATELGIDLPAVRPGPATRSYCDFLLATASLGGIGRTCAAMTPCMRLYAHLGTTLAGSAAERYAAWVDTYAAPGFEALARTLEELLDTHAADEPSTHATYRRAMELEVAFFDAAVDADDGADDGASWPGGR